LLLFPVSAELEYQITHSPNNCNVPMLLYPPGDGNGGGGVGA